MRAFLVTLLVASALAVPLVKITETTTEEDTLFERFKGTYQKVYFDSHDETYRKAIFLANLAKIRNHNEEFSQGKHTFTMAMNEFGDLTFEEFHAKYTGYRGPANNYLRSKNTADLSHVKLTADVDWTTKGAVTPVKNQGQCGSCWAFSSTGAIEGAWFLSNGTLESLSEQDLMDCSKPEGNQSCEGGLMDQAFEYVVKKGICSEAEVPYKQRDESSCKACTAVAHISKYTDVAQSEVALQAAVTQQPVAVAIEADQDSFQFYESGVLTGQCGTNLDHGVLAVGFGTLNGVQYWKVKNSWGASWGLNGYVLIEKGKKQTGGQCGILMAASYPVV